METADAVATLSALAHPGRLTIFRLLVQAGEKGIAAGQIARRLGIPSSSLSANLAALAHARLIEPSRAGRSIIYRAAYPRMTALLSYLIEDCCEGTPAICTPLTTIMARASRCSTNRAATQ